MDYTKGEWRVENRAEGIRYGVTDKLSKEEYPIVINAPQAPFVLGKAIAILPWDSIGGIEETEANARLMAASKDMYEALKPLVDYLEYLNEWGQLKEPTEKAYHRAQKALAKVEGRE